MYAITFSLDASTLEKTYPTPSWENAWRDIRTHLEQAGFTRVQDHLYFGSSQMDGVQCVLAIQEMCMALEWFHPSARSIRMLRIEENCGLMPIIESFQKAPQAEAGPKEAFIPLPPGQRLISHEVLMRNTWQIGQDAKAIHAALEKLRESGLPCESHHEALMENIQRRAKQIRRRAQNLQPPRHPEDGAVAVVKDPKAPKAPQAAKACSTPPDGGDPDRRKRKRSWQTGAGKRVDGAGRKKSRPSPNQGDPMDNYLYTPCECLCCSNGMW